MYDYEIEDLLRLRSKGYSFSAISKAMHVGISTLKKYCQDNGIVFNGAPKTKAENLLLKSCKFCGRAIEPLANGPTREFCSTKCRRNYWNEYGECSHDNYLDILIVDTPRSKKRLALCSIKSDELDLKEENDG